MAIKDLLLYFKAEDKTSPEFKKVEKSINNVKKEFAEFNKEAGKIATTTLKVSALAAALGSFAGLKNSFDSIKELDLLSQKLQLPIEKLSELKFVAEQSGLGLDVLADAYKDLDKNIGDAVGSDDFSKFEKLGISIKDAAGNLKSTETVFYELADVYKNMGNSALVAASANETMGESGTTILPILKQGAEALKEQATQAKDLGITLDDLQANTIKNLGKSWNEFKSSTEGTFNDLLTTAAPTLEAIFGAITQISQTDLIDPENLDNAQKGFANFATSIIKGFDGVFEVLGRLGNVLSAIGKGAAAQAATLKSLGEGNFKGAFEIQKTGGADVLNNIKKAFSSENVIKDFAPEFEKQLKSTFEKNKKTLEQRKLNLNVNTNPSFQETSKDKETKSKEADKQKKLNEKALKDYQKQQEEELKLFLKNSDIKKKEIIDSNNFELNKAEELLNQKVINENDFFNIKSDLINKNLQATIDALSKEEEFLKEKLNKNKDDLNIQNELARVKNEQLDAERNSILENLKLQTERNRLNEEYLKNTQALKLEILSLTGEDTRQIELEVKIKELKDQGLDENLIKQFELATQKTNQYADGLERINKLTEDIGQAEKEFQLERDKGNLSNYQYNLIITRIKEENLRLAIEEQKANISLAQTEDQKTEATKRFLELQTELASANEDAVQYAETFKKGFTDAFTEILNGQKSVSDGFKDMVKNITATFQDKLNNQLVDSLYKSLFDQSSMTQLFGSLFTGTSNGGGGGSGWASLFSGISSFFGYDTGGSVQPGRPIKVGEFGVETFVPQQAGTILSAEQTKKMYNTNNNSNTTINYTIKTPDDTAFKRSKKQIAIEQQRIISAAARLA